MKENMMIDWKKENIGKTKRKFQILKNDFLILFRHDDHYSRNNGNYSSKPSLKSRQSRREHYSSSHSSSPLSNRKGNNQSSYYDNSTLSSYQFDRSANKSDSYSPLLVNQPILVDTSHSSSVLYYNSSQSVPDRSVPSYYNDSERSQYSPLSSTTYHRSVFHFNNKKKNDF